MLNLSSASNQELVQGLSQTLAKIGFTEVDVILKSKKTGALGVMETFSSVHGALNWLTHINNPSEWTVELKLNLLDAEHNVQATDVIPGPALPYTSGFTPPAYWPS